MSKKKAPSQTQLMSPENYIRQKSRSLPLGKCFITDGWQKNGLCDIIITRKHITGNVTFCMYLADLYCLGVKDSAYKFNVPFDDIEDIRRKAKEDGESFIETPYELVHNIIHASVEFADEYGFKPCGEFTSVTSYFLEEDTDAIPLMEIKCGGDDGNPLYFNTGFESPARVREILATLKKTAGEENYDYIDKRDLDLDEDEDENEDDIFINKIENLSQEEQQKLFLELMTKEGMDNDSLTKDDMRHLVVLTNILTNNLTNEEAIDRQLNLFEENLKHEIIENSELPNSLFTGVQNVDGKRIDKWFSDITNTITDSKNPKKDIELFRELVGDVPAAYLLELLYLKQNGKYKKYAKKLKEYFQKYPDYFMTKLFEIADNLEECDRKDFEKILSGKTEPVTKHEFNYFILHYSFFLIKENVDFATILAFEEYIDSIDYINTTTYDNIVSLCYFFKMKKLIDYFEQTEKLK